MSLPSPFPFWVVAEQKGNDVGRLLYRWPSLIWLLFPNIAYFVLKGDVNLPTNQPINQPTNQLLIVSVKFGLSRGH